MIMTIVLDTIHMSFPLLRTIIITIMTTIITIMIVTTYRWFAMYKIMSIMIVTTHRLFSMLETMMITIMTIIIDNHDCDNTQIVLHLEDYNVHKNVHNNDNHDCDNAQIVLHIRDYDDHSHDNIMTTMIVTVWRLNQLRRQWS